MTRDLQETACALTASPPRIEPLWFSLHLTYHTHLLIQGRQFTLLCSLIFLCSLLVIRKAFQSVCVCDRNMVPVCVFMWL